MPVYLRRYYINKISDIHKKEEEAAKNQGSDQQAYENFENLNIDWSKYDTGQ
jgi:NAD+--asparagine ADP-ribosyltransferase